MDNQTEMEVLEKSYSVYYVYILTRKNRLHGRSEPL